MVKRDVNIICRSEDIKKIEKIIKSSNGLVDMESSDPETVDMLKELLKKNNIDFVHEYNRPTIFLDKDRDKFEKYKKGSRSLVAMFSSVGVGDRGRIDEFLDEEISDDLDLVYFIEYSNEDNLVVSKISRRAKGHQISLNYPSQETGEYVFIQETVLM